MLLAQILQQKKKKNRDRDSMNWEYMSTDIYLIYGYFGSQLVICLKNAIKVINNIWSSLYRWINGMSKEIGKNNAKIHRNHKKKKCNYNATQIQSPSLCVFIVISQTKYLWITIIIELSTQKLCTRQSSHTHTRA